MESETKARYAAGLADDKKASNIMILDVQGQCTFTDFFLLCTGHSSLQLRAIAEGIESGLKKEHVLPLAVEGKGRSNWIVLDYGDVVVHVMNEEARSYYALENLWGDARVVTVRTRSVATSNAADS